MHRVTRRTAHGQVANRNNGPRRDGAGETITGGPMEALDLMEVFGRVSRGADAGVAIPGAAHLVTIKPQWHVDEDRGVSLSDGSHISFGSVDEGGADWKEDAGQLTGA